MTAKPQFKICCNCGAECGLRVRVCNHGCGSTSRVDRRRGARSVFVTPSAEQVATRSARIARSEELLSELANRASKECGA